MRRWAAALVALAFCLAGAAVALDDAYPLPVGRLAQVSTVVVDRDGRPLRAFTDAEGRYRLATAPADVSPAYLKLLVDIEDKRFFVHPGVDPFALGRAVAQRLLRGRVVSGASTLTMQVARLLEPHPRTLRAKLVEAARAVQLEAHWSKPRILAAYLTLAPMGGNIEGVRAGSLAWFGKEPAELSDAEAALLVALPRDPNRMRPDRNGNAAEIARARVLRRAVADGVISTAALASALAAPLPAGRQPLPMLAPHLAEELLAAAPDQSRIVTTLDAGLQAGTERLLAQALHDIPRPVTLAAIVADRHTGAVLARVGNAAYFDARRTGAVDMTRAIRSPGSTLKPFIYGMAFDGLQAHPASLVRDAPTRFDDYAPHNFDGTFNGDVTVRQALQWSLNLPAVLVLQRLGPVSFSERFRAAGLALDLGSGDAAPGLPIALGGAGTTLTSLVSAYTALAEGGVPRPLHDTPQEPAATGSSLFGAAAADAVTDILSDMPPPSGVPSRAGRIAYKTGTSYRFRDGWAVGFDDAHVTGIWMGRADGGTCACVGASAAAVLFRVFDLLPPAPLARRSLAPIFAGPPPPALARLDPIDQPVDEQGPRITFPLDQSRLLLAQGGGTDVKLAAIGGQRPYRWLVDGKPLDSRAFAHEAAWQPGLPGFSTIVVVDALGRSAQTGVRVDTGQPTP